MCVALGTRGCQSNLRGRVSSECSVRGDTEPTVLKFLKRLFGANPPAPETAEQAVRRLLATLPSCPRYVVGASPSYGNERYRGEVLLDTEELLPWAQKRAGNSYGSYPDIQAAADALPIWLRAADRSNAQPAYLPAPFVDLLSSSIGEFAGAGGTLVSCPDCGSRYGEILKEKLNVERQSIVSRWTDEWYCPKGHLLYRANQETRINLGRR